MCGPRRRCTTPPPWTDALGAVRPKLSAPDEFTLGNGSVVSIETMCSLREAPYAEVDGWRAVRLPYNEALHADILLPPRGVDPADANASLLARIGGVLDAA